MSLQGREAEGAQSPIVRPAPAAASPRPAIIATLSSTHEPFLRRGGEMGSLIRALDWSETPIGGFEQWSQSLRMMVSFLLANRFPLLLWWGPQYTSIYNDAYRPILGNKHPWALGRPVSEVWAEIWDVLKPLIDTPFMGGEATWIEDLELELNRHGFLEETHFTVAYSAVPDETASQGIGGVLATVHEITEKIVSERRVVLLRDLGLRAAHARTAQEACANAAAVLSQHPKDIPFALLYLIDVRAGEAKLAGVTGIETGTSISPPKIRLDATDEPWPIANVLLNQELTVIENLGSRFAAVPPGPWRDPPHSAAIIPVRSNKPNELVGFVIAGVSARLRLDHLYRSFFELMAAQIATSIANAQAYEEECKRAEALAEIDRAKTAFFSNVSHEFRTPLTLMLGPLEEALAMPADSLPQHRETLVVAHRSGLRLLRLVNTLLDFSRIEAGRVQASYEPVDLAALTSGLADEFRPATDKAGLRLMLDCPPLAEPVWVDRDMWEKIVLNLVSNAFKFTLEGAITVRLRADSGSGHAVLTVEDTGVGIPESELPRIFDRFHRVEGAGGRTHEGTGIGLALVQELARLHGGSVAAASRPGAGSTFTVSMPFGTADLPADRLRAARSLQSTALGAQPYIEEALRWLPGAPSGPDRTEHIAPDIVAEPMPIVADGNARADVLVVDDNADMRDYVTRLLIPHYEVHTAADGEEALALIRQQRPDLVLSDVMMPRLDGLGLVRQIRADAILADIPVVLLSARAGEEASSEGFEVGADDYLVKPFSSRELLARVTANLNMAKLRRGFQERIEADLQAMTLLRELGAQCARANSDPTDCLQQILATAMALGGATRGNVQLLDRDTRALVIAAQQGFEAPFLTFFAHVADDGSACAAAMRTGGQTVVEDVATSEIFVGQRSLQVMIEAGARAVISTPLIGSDGSVLGMVSVHFPAPHRPSERELHFLGLLGRQAADYLERRRAAEIQHILVRELQHRGNNLLAVVQAIAHGSLAGNRSLADARVALEARLHALARANRRLTQSNFDRTSLDELVRLELTPFIERTMISGPSVMLSSMHAQNISLALHELSTNAAKYGAFSSERGKVAISWALSNKGKYKGLTFIWAESGGPPVVPPKHSGFGTTLLKALGGEIRFQYERTGLNCEIDMPLGEAELGSMERPTTDDIAASLHRSG
jgi:signal transduction histidine kinase/CheY-like chemotaxis protein